LEGLVDNFAIYRKPHKDADKTGHDFVSPPKLEAYKPLVT